MKTKNPPLIPFEILDPIGIEGTKTFARCADNWTDSEVGQLRARLPIQYHAVPLDALRRMWARRRQKGVEGYKLNGTGPKKGWKEKRAKKERDSYFSEEHQKYLDSDDWKERRPMWLIKWGFRCSVCNAGTEAILDIHHRTYERRGHEEETDCIVLCRACHTLFHEHRDLCKENGGAK